MDTLQSLLTKILSGRLGQVITPPVAANTVAAPAAAPVVKPTYDTVLSQQEELAFKRAFPNWEKASADYDLRGAWKEGIKPDERGHLPDTYKKPNHITFSNESIYHNQGGNIGGEWKELPGSKWSFAPSKTNLTNTPTDKLQEYFKKYEPDSTLVLPQEKPQENLSGATPR